MNRDKPIMSGAETEGSNVCDETQALAPFCHFNGGGSKLIGAPILEFQRASSRSEARTHFKE